MSSPFKRYVNLKLEIAEGNNTFVRNPDTGLLEEVEATKKLFLASVDSASPKASIIPMSGLNANSVYLVGTLVSPKYLPKTLGTNDRCKAWLIDPATKGEVEGEFLFELVAQSRFKPVSKALGSQIKGFFTSLG